MKQRTAALLTVGFGFILFCIDRALKQLALAGTTLGPAHGGVRFEFFQNPAIAFSIAFPKTLSIVLIPVVLGLFMFVALYWYRKNDVVRSSVLFVLIMAAFSNYLDRLQHGYVIDYVSVGDWFPVFNVSDLVIVFALIVIVASGWAEKRKKTLEHK
ncbi:MAG: signal peptidase II [Candidatus Kerfeldbacteria bacterium]